MTGARTEFGNVAARWEAVRGATFSSIVVDDSILRTLLNATLRLLAVSTDADAEGGRVVAAVRRVGFRAQVLPVPPARAILWGPHSPERLLAMLDERSEGMPHSVWAEARVALQAFYDQGDIASPAWSALAARLQDLERPIALVALEPRYCSPLEQVLVGQPGLPIVVTIEELKWRWDRNTIVLFGPPSVYPTWVTSFPRGHVLWVHHTWNRPPNTEFQHLSRTVREPRSRRFLKVLHADQPTTVDAVNIEVERSLVPRLDGAALAERARRDSLDDREEYVAARLVELADGCSVFLSTDDGSRALALIPEAGELERVRVDRILPGWFLVLRTDADRDYVRDIADTLLGSEASELRARVTSWKRLLRDRVNGQGLDGVVRRLAELGVSEEAQTVRNWMTEEVMGPRHRESLDALFKFLGLEDSEEDWEVLRRLRGAGMQAGRNIRSRLLAQVGAVDMAEARRHARIDFTLDDVVGSTVSAFMVTAVTTGAYDLPRAALNVVSRGDA